MISFYNFDIRKKLSLDIVFETSYRVLFYLYNTPYMIKEFYNTLYVNKEYCSVKVKEKDSHPLADLDKRQNL